MSAECATPLPVKTWLWNDLLCVEWT